MATCPATHWRLGLTSSEPEELWGVEWGDGGSQVALKASLTAAPSPIPSTLRVPAGADGNSQSLAVGVHSASTSASSPPSTASSAASPRPAVSGFWRVSPSRVVDALSRWDPDLNLDLLLLGLDAAAQRPCATEAWALFSALRARGADLREPDYRESLRRLFCACVYGGAYTRAWDVLMMLEPHRRGSLPGPKDLLDIANQIWNDVEK